MPRKKTHEVAEKKEETGEAVVKPKHPKKTQKGFEIEELFAEYFSGIVESMNLANLGLDDDTLKRILFEPFASAVGDVKTKPKLKTIINRLMAKKEDLFEYLAIRILREKEDSLTTQQLEFCVYYVRRGISEFASLLYRLSLQTGREDLINYLRTTWDQYGIRTPIRCPVCGFSSIMPDLVCTVCGTTITEKKMKEIIGISLLLRDMKELDPEGYKEISKSLHVYFTENGLVSPLRFHQGSRYVYELVLSKKDFDQN